MKKLILTILIIAGIGFFAQSQTVRYDYKSSSVTLDTFNITTIDTNWTYPTNKTYSVSVSVYWTEFIGTLDGVFKIQATLDKQLNEVNWNDISGLSYTPADTVGSKIFHIPNYTATDYYAIRLLFDRGAVTGGKIIPMFMFNEIKK